MFRNYLKIAVRNMKKYKSYSTIIFGSLVLSLTVFFLIASYVLYELSYDRFFENSDRIYRVSLERKYPRLVRNFAFIGPGVGPSIKSDLPGVDEFVRIQKREGIIKYDKKTFKQDNILCVDSTFLNVFPLKLVSGNKTNVLNTPLSSVISLSFSNKLFGDESPVGKVITMNDSINIYIAGVAEDLPSNSHFHFDLLVSSFPEWNEARAPLTTWGWFGFNTYLLLNDNTSYKTLDSKLNKLTSKYLRNEFGGEDYDEWVKNQNYYRFYLTPLTNIHLDSNMAGELGINGNMEKVYFFSIIALFVLFIGCINFVNLITARFSTRTKEVGVRKVLGSKRGNLITQFMGESLLMVSLSVLMSIYLVSIFIPVFNANLNKQIELSGLVTPITVISLFVFTLVLGIISGFYPALFLSNFDPISIFQGKISSRLKTSHTRNILVVAQFSLTIILIVGTVLVYDQLEYVINKEIGFNKKNIVTIGNSNILQSSKETFKREILKDNNIGYASYSTGLPSFVDNPATYRLSTANENDNINMQTIWADNDFLQTFGLSITTGRDFIPNDIVGGQHVAIINEAAANKLGWEKEAVGKEIHIIDNTRLAIQGILKDFNFESLHQNIEPLVIIATDPATIRTNFFSVKISGNNIRQTLEFIEDNWNKFTAGAGFEYNFLDERIASLYENEQQTLKLFLSFSIISILVACLGLFGLVSFAIEQRTKEIGIRKVLGATVSNITLSLSRNFVGLVLIANIIAWPVGYFMMSLWLQDFAYRISINWLIFVFAGSLSFVIALLTVSAQTIRAALANPVESLRYE
jgi:putative ABC transport system permease protein